MKKFNGQMIIKEELSGDNKATNIYFNEEILHTTNEVFQKFVSAVNSYGSKISFDVTYDVEISKNSEDQVIDISYLHDQKNIQKLKLTIAQRLQEKKDLIQFELTKSELSKITILALNNLLNELEKFVSLNEQTLKIEEKIAKDKSTIKSNKALINSFLSRDI